jgi:Flp pilus assembly protein CpaB
MTDTRVRTATGHGSAAPDPPTVRRRRPLPGGRAVLGAFLIAVAVVGVFGAYLSATAEPDSAYAVAAETLDAGAVITKGDIRLVRMNLPPEVRARSIADVQALLGATVLHPLRPGELIRSGDVIRGGGARGTRELSFAVEGSRALGERIAPGERIDVLATYGSGEQAYTVVVVADTPVLRVDPAGGGLAGEGRVELTVALDRAEDALALAHAVDVGQVTVVRATNGGSALAGGSYRPPAPTPGEAGGTPRTQPESRAEPTDG